MVWSTSVALAPLLGSQLIEASGTAAVWTACLALGFVAAGIHLVLARLRRAPASEDADPVLQS